MTENSGSRWLRYFRFVRPDVPADVDDELGFHLEMRIERNLALGMTPDDARREAITRFGDVGSVRATLVDHDRRKHNTRQRAEYVADFVQDLKFGSRALRRSPAFAVAAILTLALGIGANTAIFSVVNAVVLRPLPYAQPDRLVAIGDGSLGEYLALRSRLHTIVDLAAWAPATHPVSIGDEAARLNGVAITTNLMPLLGVTPSIGRGFTPADGEYGSDNVVLISDALWRREFAGASAVDWADDLDRGTSVHDRWCHATIIPLPESQCRVLAAECRESQQSGVEVGHGGQTNDRTPRATGNARAGADGIAACVALAAR